MTHPAATPPTATVLQRRVHLNQLGQRLPDTLHDTDQTISAGLVCRLQKYARKELLDLGFAFEGWACEVYTMDADLASPERFYTVEFTGPRGGQIGVQGILTEHGWPCLNHGLCIGRAS